MSYNGRPVGEGGIQLRPDLATALPDASDDRKTWTFQLRSGLHYAPPLDDVEITAPDLVRALERTAKLPAAETNGYAFYYSIIDGFDRYGDGKADSISGLETPDDHTLVVHLREPSTDLPGFFALHTTSPLPPSPDDPDAPYGVATGHDDDFGRYLVSTGPYMFEQEAPVDIQRRFSLVRNPSWDASQDDLRPAFPDRIEVTRDFDKKSLVARLDDGRLDVLLNLDHPPAAFARLQADPSLRDRVIDEPSAAIWYAVMNLAMRPFDDVHVRKALNHVVDRRQLAQRVTDSGFFIPAQPYGHMASDSLQDNLLLDYRPYGAPDGGPDLVRARAEMARSRYDSNGDGRCDHPACRNLFTEATHPVLPGLASFTSDLKEIGIDIRPRKLSIDRFYGRPWPERKLPLAFGNGWIDDNRNASTVFEPLVRAENAGNFTTALVGAKPAQLREWGYRVTRVPNVDSRLDLCAAQVGHRQLRCWAELDAYLMEKVVAFAPLLGGRAHRIVSERVVQHSWDPSTNQPAVDRFILSEDGR